MIGLLMMLAAPDAIGFKNGNDLYESCIDTNSTLTCLSYIQGVMDLQMATQSFGSTKVICATTAVNGRQVMDVVTAYLRDHPAIRSQGAAGITILALSDAFPCGAR